MAVSSIRMDGFVWERGDEMPEQVINLVANLAAVENYSEHPVAAAIMECADEAEVVVDASVDDFQSEPGFGISANVAGHRIVAGTSAWMDRCQIERNADFNLAEQELDQQGIGSLRCAIDGKELALLAVEDHLRQDAPQLIADLKQEGMQLTMISGDRRHAAESLAQRWEDGSAG